MQSTSVILGRATAMTSTTDLGASKLFVSSILKAVTNTPLSYSWIVAQYTEDPALAVTNIIITIQGKAIGGKIDMATGAGGDFRYVDYSVDRGNRNKIQSIYLWRSKKFIGISDLNAQGLNGMSIDINKGRSGDYLYLVWKTAVV